MQQLGQSARDRKPETRSILQLRLSELHELLEDPLLIGFRDSFALIDDLNHDAALVGRLGDHLNRFRAAELDGVGQEVEQDLPQPPRIGDDAYRVRPR